MSPQISTSRDVAQLKSGIITAEGWKGQGKASNKGRWTDWSHMDTISSRLLLFNLQRRWGDKKSEWWKTKTRHDTIFIIMWKNIIINREFTIPLMSLTLLHHHHHLVVVLQTINPTGNLLMETMIWLFYGQIIPSVLPSHHLFEVIYRDVSQGCLNRFGR